MMGYGRGIPDYGYGRMMDSRFFDGGLFGPWMMLFGALFVLGIIILIVWAVRATHRHAATVAHAPAGAFAPTAPVAHADDAVQIARRRYASGEVTTEQYAEIMQALSG